ncbi:hydroxyacid dehydrogenase [Salinigranum salinum]|uniref:hydroxyacid dehydrogenase n=1 Tax=Salinigranum salinum TaxID=1364937 RepID=UPI00126135D5|nr:hydroxyacid dehydrogenase [Salinigranum salinum]
MAWDVLIAGDIAEDEFEMIDDIARFTETSHYRSRDELLSDISRFDAIIVRSYDIDSELLQNATKLKVISKRGVGVDSIDVETATEMGVVVCNTPGANAQAVAEHTIGLLLAVRKKLLVADRDVRDGMWQREKYVGHELSGDVLGIFGFGNIGEIVARIAKSIGMDAVVYDPYVTRSELPSHVRKTSTLGDLFSRSDVVSIHAPLTDETRNIIGEAEFETFSRSGILLNTARAEIVNEKALLNALQSSKIAGAGLDVLHDEPPAEASTIYDLDNVVLSPHIAGTTIEANKEKSRRAAEHVRMVHDGELPSSTLNDGVIN